MAQQVSTFLSDYLGAPVRIGEASIGLPGHVRLNEVVLYDRADTLMLSAKTVDATLSVFDLLQNKRVRLRSVALLDGEARVYQARSDTALNVQFLLDAFKGSDETTQPTDVQISQLVVRRFRVRYDRFDAPRLPANLFDVAHVDVKQLSASLSLPSLTDDLLHLDVRQLSFQEQSGFVLEHLKGEFWLTEKSLKLRDFQLRLPHSFIAQKELQLAFQPDNIWGTLYTSGILSNAFIATDDIAMFLPKLASWHTQLNVSTAFDITPRRIVLRDMFAAVDQPTFVLQGDVQVDHTGNVVDAVVLRSEHLATDVTQMSQFLQQQFGVTLPQEVVRLESVNLQGQFAWHRQRPITFDGTISTAQGSLRGHLDYLAPIVRSNLVLTNVQIASILDNKSLPTSISATVDGTAHVANSPSFDGSLNLMQMIYRDRLIHDVAAKGHINTQGLALQIDSRDASATMYGSLQASLEEGRLHNLTWNGEISHFEPSLWGLDVPRDMIVSLDGKVQAENIQALSRLEMDAEVHHLAIQGGGFNVNQHDLSLSLHPQDEYHEASLSTPYGRLSLSGPLNVDRLRQAVENILRRTLPDFQLLSSDNVATQTNEGNAGWDFDLQIDDDALFSEIVHLPIYAPSGLKVSGRLAEGDGRTSLSLYADTLSYDSQQFSDVQAFLQGEGEEYSLLLQTTKSLAGMDLNLAATIQTTGHEVTTQLSWLDKKEVFRGELAAFTTPYSAHRGTMITTLESSEVAYKDSVWTLVGGTVLWGGDTLSVRNLLVEHEDQHISVDGSFSQGSPDSITADLQNIDLEYVFDLLKFHPVEFAGVADGHAVLTFAKERPVVNAHLDIQDFSINDGPLGRADIRGEVDLEALHVTLDADMLEAPFGRTIVHGMVLPNETQLDLDIHSEGTNLQFLRRYLGGILHDISGRATGRSRLYGTFKELQLTGDVMAHVKGDLPVLGCAYDVDSAHVVMTPNLIDIRSGHVYDQQGGEALAQGEVHHRHLSDFHYTFNFDLDHCLLYDKERTPDITFSSHALASGHVTLSGEPGRLDCNIDVRPERGTNFIYHIDLPDDYTSSTLLTLRSANTVQHTDSTDAENADLPAVTSNSDIYMTLNLDMQPDVPLTVVMDEKTGDNIVVNGSGKLNATYYNKGQFNLYGTYRLESGTYKMTIQDIIHKDFRFQEGGTVIFGGKPFDGILNMQAVYTVPSASLADLNLTSGVSQTGVRVNCLLNFSGLVRDPKVQFDMDMPTVSQDVKQMVRSLISTDEEMNRQVLYLLAIGRFYTYDYADTNSSYSQGETAMNSFLSNTLSGQLNNFIASAIGQSNWTFGTNVSTGSYGWEDVGVEGQIGGRLLNNRLLINGNFGYRNNVTQQSATLIGDFDVQYLLSPNGTIRLKAYNETNDRYFTKNSLTTQGVGVVATRSFNRFSEFFRRKKTQENVTTTP